MKLLAIWFLYQLFSITLSLKCGNSPDFANFRRPKPLDIAKKIIKNNELFGENQEDDIPRIINGQMTSPGAWPWQVSLQLQNPIVGNIGHWCGAVLVSSRWVATAAHCVNNKLISALGGGIWTVILGDWDRDNSEGPELEMIVEKIVVHPNFTDYQNDIALLRLPSNIKTIEPICLPQQEEPSVGLRCITTGWGQTTNNGQLESRLHQSMLRVVDTRDCGKLYGLKYGVKIGSGHVCAGPERGHISGTCVGDSGGPLQCNYKDGKWYLVGLTSFGSGCAKPGYPDVFVRVATYTKWIHQIIHESGQ